MYNYFMEDIKITSKEGYEKIVQDALEEVEENSEEFYDVNEAIDEIAREYTGSLSRNMSILKHSKHNIGDWNLFSTNNNYNEVIEAMAYNVFRKELKSRVS